jgi:hypothetical protein
MSPRSISSAAIAAALLACGAPAHASRIVIVNGALMSPASLDKLDRAACARIPDGSYWLNTRTGAWGYVGDSHAQGVIGERCVTGGAGGQNQDGTYGPYATMRRAEEVAKGFRARGMRAVSFHNGDGYYVRASR